MSIEFGKDYKKIDFTPLIGWGMDYRYIHISWLFWYVIIYY